MAEPEEQEGSPREGARLGGAAADFATGLGRKVGELRTSLDALSEAPDRVRGRDELRRKLHALGVGARLLHFEALARAIAEATDRIDAEANDGVVSDALLDELSRLLQRIPDLAWQKATPTVTPPPAQEDEPLPALPPPATPWTVLVVGGEPLGQVVSGDPRAFPCEIEHTDVDAALDLARTLAPELIVVDADATGAVALIEALVEDALTGPVPVVAIATPGDPELAARLTALGVTKLLAKPPRPAELRATCAALIGAAQGAAHAALHPDLGVVTIAELADRLAEEVRRALVGEADPSSTGVRVSLGVGAEILGPFWGALARVRDVLESRSQGAILFHGRARGPVAVASSLSGVEAPERNGQEFEGDSDRPPVLFADRRARPRHPGVELDLGQRIVVVADDDAGVRWFLGDVLKGAGAIVLEAKDGGEALALARGSGADAILSDVLMPRVDGLTLARTLQRDVALRDRPIVLLSWKEDLLKRLRDLRMDSHAMLRKEADGRTILARVREVMLPRLRIEARIAQGGEVRGRLDDLSAASLLEITSRLRREASIVVRDAVHVFEIELDGGGIRRLSRATTDGDHASGVDVLPSLLGVVGGRFLVRAPGPADDRAPPLEGDLNAQLAPVLRRLRAACDALTGAHTVEVAAVGLESTLLAWYLRATPPPVRALLERIAQGASPRAMILGGEIAPATLEDVLLDVAARGMVTTVRGERGDDLLAAAVRALDVAPAPLIDAHAGARPSVRAPAAQPTQPQPSVEMGDLMPPSIAPPPTAAEAESGGPDSLADAVLVASSGERRTGSKPIIDTRALKPRSVSARSDPPPGSGEPRSNPPNERRSPGPLSATPTPGPVAPVVEPSAEEPRVDTLAGIGLHPVEPKPSRPASQPPEALEAALAAERADRERAEAAARDAEARAQEARALAEAHQRAAKERDERDERERLERVAREKEQREFEDKLAARRRRSAPDDAIAVERPAPVVAVDRPSQRPRVSAAQAAAARKRIRSDAVFWWIVLALGVVGASIAFYVQQQEESAPQKPAAPLSSTSPSPSPSP